MRVKNINKVKPAKDNIVIKIVEPNDDNKLFSARISNQDDKNAEFSFGEVLAIGPTANDVEHCPNVATGDNVVFNRFAGAHIATDDVNELYKIMGGYSIMAKIDNINNLNSDTVTPTSNRLLIKVKYKDQDDSGLILLADAASDPRLEDLDYGTIVKVGPSCKLGYKVNDIVAYNPYAGENIRNAISADIPALRVLIEEDVLLTI